MLYKNKKINKVPVYLIKIMNDPTDPIFAEQLRTKEYSHKIEVKKGERIVYLPWSGGLDSTTSLLMALESGIKIKTVNFNYGQEYYSKELNFIKNLTKLIRNNYRESSDLWTEHFSIDISWLNSETKKPFEGDWRHIFPFRNFIILNETAILARKDIYSEVWFSCVQGEIPFSGGDKSAIFLNQIEKLFGTYNVSLFTPLIGLTKTDIVDWAKNSTKRYKIITKTISCFSGEGNSPCGKCQSCFNRAVAFFSANKISDVGFVVSKNNLVEYIEYYRNKLAGVNSYSSKRKTDLQSFIKYLEG